MREMVRDSIYLLFLPPSPLRISSTTSRVYSFSPVTERTQLRAQRKVVSMTFLPFTNSWTLSYPPVQNGDITVTKESFQGMKNVRKC